MASKKRQAKAAADLGLRPWTGPGPDSVRVRRMVTEPLKSTVLLTSDCPSGELLAFTASIGAPMSGAGNTGVICTNGDTNVHVAAQLVDEGMIVREIQYEIPRAAQARFQLPLPCGKRRCRPVLRRRV